MSSDDGQSNYYVRVRGKVLGPYSIKQLIMLRTRGQISQSNEVSSDGSNWESAARLREVFESAPKSGKRGNSGDGFDLAKREPEATQDTPKGQWYYSLDGAQLGPVPKTDLIQMLGVGALKPEDLIWTEGMTEWQPVADTVDFANLLPQTTRASGKSRSGIESGSNDMPDHFLDYLLGGLRNGLNESSIRTMEAIPIEIGRWAIYGTMAVTLLLFCYIGVKSEYPLAGLLGIAFILSLVAYQFAAVKTSAAINRSLRANPQRMSSTVFLDSLAVLFAATGLGLLAVGVFLSAAVKVHVILMIGIAVLILFLQMAFVLLNPRMLAITIDSRVSMAEEALAVMTFVLMLPARFAIPLFAMGALIADIGLIVMFCIVIGSKEPNAEFFRNLDSTQSFIGFVTTAASLPVFAYLYCVLVSLIIGLLQAILAIPKKLDDLTSNLPTTSPADVALENSSR